MIEKLTIHNFQCHKKAMLEFAPGVNVIAGTSDSGKSALLKALIWVLTNRPSGLGFRHWDCGKGDEMVAEIASEEVGFRIARRRSEQVNDYIFNGDKFMALRTDVPSEIQAAHNMDAVNIQTQFAPHFLLSQSAGEVAKVLNEACDLSIIDRTVKKIKSIAQDAKAEAQAAEVSISKAEKEISGLAWVDDAETALELLETEMHHIQRKDDQISGLFSTLQDVWEVDKRIAEIRAKMPLFAPINDTAEAISALVEKDRQAANLDEILHDLKSVQKDIIRIKIVQVSEAAEKEIWEEIRCADFAMNAAAMLGRLINDLRTVDKQRRGAAVDWKKVEDELKKEWAEVGQCPLCGATQGQ